VTNGTPQELARQLRDAGIARLVIKPVVGRERSAAIRVTLDESRASPPD
jgi:hypothetical protein